MNITRQRPQGYQVRRRRSPSIFEEMAQYGAKLAENGTKTGNGEPPVIDLGKWYAGASAANVDSDDVAAYLDRMYGSLYGGKGNPEVSFKGLSGDLAEAVYTGWSDWAAKNKLYGWGEEEGEGNRDVTPIKTAKTEEVFTSDDPFDPRFDDGFYGDGPSLIKRKPAASTPAATPVKAQPKEEPGYIDMLYNWFFGEEEEEPTQEKKLSHPTPVADRTPVAENNTNLLRTISAQDIADLANKRVGSNAVLSFEDLMSQIAYGESGNKNIFQNALDLNPAARAQGYYQMEAEARKAANNYAAALARALGKEFTPYTEEQLSDITKLPREDQDLLAYAYMYGPENVKTADVLTGKVDVPQFWMQNWNKGQVDRSQEFGQRISDWPGR